VLNGVDTLEWKALVAKWRRWEESFGFVQAGHNKAKLSSAKIRPTAVQWWISRGRQGSLNIGDLMRFAEQWWDWWIKVNPEWREKGEDRKLALTGKGPWDKLQISGINGLLSPLMCLFWWSQAVGDMGDDSAWSRAVAEMTWVLNCL
ncbi:hypothetical protein C8J56DRAFT_745968, partial [Mycena floridula]